MQLKYGCLFLSAIHQVTSVFLLQQHRKYHFRFFRRYFLYLQNCQFHGLQIEFISDK